MLAACGGTGAADDGGSSAAVTGESSSVQSDNSHRVARDGAQMQTTDKSKSTRVLNGGTKIRMHFGDTVIPGRLNDSSAAKQLISMLPYTVHMSRFSHDFCGVMDKPLTDYTQDEVHYGWLNGDIDFAQDADYFTVLFQDEERSEQFGDQINLGVVDGDLSAIANLEGSYDVRIELA